MFSFNLILTERCNAVCTHCYMSSAEKCEKRTMTQSELLEIVNKFPEDTKTVVFTGGEVYLVRDLLYFAIKAVHEKNPNIEIGVETNGIWLYNNPDKVQAEFEELKSAGVSFVRFSDDVFHEQGGVNLEKVRALKVFESEKTPKIKYLVQTNAFGIGRAESLPEELKGKNNCMNTENSLKNPYLFLDVDGKVFSCAWKCSPSLGNMLTDSFERIVEATNEKINNLILQGKIEQAVCESSEMTEAECVKFVENEGQCMLCHKVFQGR